MSDPDVQFSIVIPTYNRPQRLCECLDSLCRLEYPRDRFEVIVVDDGGNQPLDDVVNSFADRLSVQLVRQANAGPGRARNTGAAAARGRFLVFTDDDCWLSPDYLTCMHRRLDSAPDSMIGGHTVNRLEDNIYASTSQVIVDVVYAFYNPDPAHARFFTSNNFAVAAELYRQVQGFDSGFFRAASEDRELCDRWRHEGRGMIYAPECIVLHGHDLTFGGFCKQHFTYGRGALRYHQLRHRRRSGHMRQDLPFQFQLPRLLRKPLSQLPASKAGRVVVLLGVWQVVNAAGFLYEVVRSMWTDQP